jgi:hypothetical protein
MPTETLSPGPPTLMVQNRVYALPAVRCLMFTDTAGTYEQSAILAGPFIATVALAGGQVEVAGGFIRCTTASPTVTLKRA